MGLRMYWQVLTMFPYRPFIYLIRYVGKSCSCRFEVPCSGQGPLFGIHIRLQPVDFEDVYDPSKVFLERVYFIFSFTILSFTGFTVAILSTDGNSLQRGLFFPLLTLFNMTAYFSGQIEGRHQTTNGKPEKVSKVKTVIQTSQYCDNDI